MLTLLIMKEKEKEKKKININKILKYLCYFKKLVIEIILRYSRKKFKQRWLSIYFLSEISPLTLDFLDLLLHPQKFQRKQAFTPTNSGKLSGTPCKFQGQNPRAMEIRLEFLLSTSGDCSSYLIDPWNFQMLFLQYPLKFHILSPLPPPCLRRNQIFSVFT